MLIGFVGRRLINRDYAFLWFGQAISLMGDYVFATTIVLWVGVVLGGGKRWAPVAVGGVSVAVAAGMIAAAPLAGVLVDRLDRRKTMLVTDALRGAMMALWAMASWLWSDTLPAAVWLSIAYPVVFLASAATQFFRPARLALIAEVVSDEDARTRAAGLQQLSVAVGSVIGPPLAAPLLLHFGIGWTLAVNAASFAVSYVAVRAIRVPSNPARVRKADGEDESAAGSFDREFKEGLRLFLRNRVLVIVLVCVIVTAMASGPVNALNVFFLSENLHAGPQWYGAMAMALGTGSIVGAAMSGAITRRLGSGRTVGTGVLLCGVFFVFYSRVIWLPVALLLLVLAGIVQAVMNTAFVPLVLKVTPADFLGRVMAVINPLQQLASMISVALCSWLVSTVLMNLHLRVEGIRIGRVDTVVFALGIMVIAAGVLALRPHGLTDADRASHPEDAEATETAATP